MKLKQIFRWRLQSLLILIAVSAVGFATWNRLVVPYDNQTRAIKVLLGVSNSLTARPGWLSSVDATRFKQVHLFQTRTQNSISDKLLEPLHDLCFLEDLDISGTSAGDPTAARIGVLRKLKRADLSSTRITDIGLRLIAGCKQLERLDLSDTCISDDGLASLAKLGRLNDLTLSETICGDGLAQLAAMPRLGRLDLSRTSVDVDSLGSLAGSRLHELVFTSRVSGEVCASLAKLPELTVFDTAIVQADDADLAEISKCQRLESLSIEGVGVTDAGVKHLTNMQGLRHLRLLGDLTDESLMVLKKMSSLKSLEVSGRFSRKAIQDFGERTDFLAAVRSALVPPDSATSSKIGSSLLEISGSQTNSPHSLKITWPARVADVKSMSQSQRESVTSVTLTNPQTVEKDLSSEFQVEWSLEGIELLPNIRSLETPRVNIPDLAKLNHSERFSALVLHDDRLTNQELAQITLPKGSKLILDAVGVTKNAIADKNGSFSVERTNKQGNVYFDRRWRMPMGTLADVTEIENVDTVQVENLRKKIALSPLASAPTIKELAMLDFRAETSNDLIFQQDQPLPNITTLTIVSTQCDDHQLAQLNSFPGLRRLVIRGSRMTDRSFRHIAKLPALESLNLDAKYVTGSGFGELAKIKTLKLLEIRNMVTTPKRWAELAKCKQLIELRFPFSNVTDDACPHLNTMPNLRTLNINYSDVTDEGLIELGKSRSLEKISVGSASITVSGLRGLANCETLKEINIRGRMNREQLDRFKADFRHLIVD